MPPPADRETDPGYAPCSTLFVPGNRPELLANDGVIARAELAERASRRGGR
jgi:hypothetical protein